MALNKRSKVREIAEIPGIIELMKRHTGQEVSPAMLEMAGAMNLQTAARSMGWSDETLDEMITEINEKLG